jgi:NADPH:quinone reductase-like Zn-dependent oxidoreductase
MKAIVYNQYGTPEVLQLKEVEKPLPRDNEVLVKVSAASINSWDWDLLRGRPYLYRSFFGVFEPRNKILGCDIAGHVEAVGVAVKHFKPGDEVFGDISPRFGGFAEYVCTDEKSLTLKPTGIIFAEAAAIPQAAVLAMQGLCDKRQIGKGDKVLINGAGGGVGTFGVQLAKYFGAEVTCVDNGAKLDKLRSLGADYVIDYKTEDFTKNGQHYDLIIDVVANRSIFKYQRALLPNGVFVMVGGTIPAILQAAFIGPLISQAGSRKLGILLHQANKNLHQIIELCESGTIKPVIDKTFSLSEVPEAFRHFGDGRFVGKIVITME